MALVGAFIDEDARGAFGLSRPKIAFPSPHSDEAETVQVDITVLVAQPRSYVRYGADGRIVEP